jgi:hypothetical protein
MIKKQLAPYKIALISIWFFMPPRSPFYKRGGEIGETQATGMRQQVTQRDISGGVNQNWLSSALVEVA